MFVPCNVPPQLRTNEMWMLNELWLARCARSAGRLDECKATLSAIIRDIGLTDASIASMGQLLLEEREVRNV